MHTEKYHKPAPEIPYGRTMREPRQVLKKLWTGDETSEVRNTYQYVLERLEETCRLAREFV